MPKKSKKSKGSKATKSKKGSSTATVPQVEFQNGSGHFHYPNGDEYQGEYCAHISGLIWKEGHGVYITKDGQLYEADWKDDKILEANPVSIVYANGARYYGQLRKNKYDGPGYYTFESGLVLNCTFKDNKPTGDLVFLDLDEKVYTGVAQTKWAIVRRENIFYKNISEDRGKGKRRLREPEQPEEQREPEGPDVIVEEPLLDDHQQALYLDQYYRDKVFGKSKKTSLDLSIGESDYIKTYSRFKNTKEKIMRKIRDEGLESLSTKERAWWDKYENFKQEYKKKFEDIHKPKRSEITTKLLEEYFKQMKEEGPSYPIRVIYPTTPDDEDEDKSASSLQSEKEWNIISSESAIKVEEKIA